MVSGRVGQIGNINNTTPTYTLGGTDAAKFKIVAKPGWAPSPTRSAPFYLETNGNQGGQANGYSITITPSDGSATAFHIGPVAPSATGATHNVTTANAQSVINSSSDGDTFIFASGSYGSLTLRPGVYISPTPMTTGGLRAVMDTPTFANNITVFGFSITGSSLQIGGFSNLNLTNNHFTGAPVFTG